MKTTTNGLLALGAGLIGYSLNSERGTQLRNYVVQYVAPYVAPLAAANTTTSASNTTSDDNILHYDCRAGEYTTELLNLDPPILYINNFLSEDEIVDLVRLGNGIWEDSTVADDPSVARNKHMSRTSTTAFLPRHAPVVECVMERAHRFLGFYDFDEIESPQLTRYNVGQEYQAHFDWPPVPWRESARNNQRFERFSTFFVYLEANCTGGSTHFPRVSTEKLDDSKVNKTKYEYVTVPTEPDYTHTSSLAVKPIAGNAVFWVNTPEEGKGHPLTKHAGMPVHEGTKIGLNIWSRRYLPEDEGMTKPE